MSTSPTGRRAQEIALEQIDVGGNVRELDAEHVRALAGSMAVRGLVVPVAVRPLDDGQRFALVAGEHRLAAARELGWTSIAAAISEQAEGASGDQGAENVLRKTLTPLSKFVDGAKTAGELYGRTLVVFACQHYAQQLALPTSQRRGSVLPRSRADRARNAFEKVTNTVLSNFSDDRPCGRCPAHTRAPRRRARLMSAAPATLLCGCRNSRRQVEQGSSPLP